MFIEFISSKSSTDFDFVYGYIFDVFIFKTWLVVCDYPSTLLIHVFNFKMSFIWYKFYLIHALKCWKLFLNVSYQKKKALNLPYF